MTNTRNAGVRVRIPALASIAEAVAMYYQRIELSNRDIQTLFGGKIGKSTVQKLKAKAREEMANNNTPVWNSMKVNTEDAFKAWGLDIDDLERRLKKLEKLQQAGGGTGC